jgi:hypothetical protein
MTQVVTHLFGMHEALGSIPTTERDRQTDRQAHQTYEILRQ